MPRPALALAPAVAALAGRVVRARRAVLANPAGAHGVIVRAEGPRWRVLWANGRVGWLSPALRQLYGIEVLDAPRVSLPRIASDTELIDHWRQGVFRGALHP